MGGDPVISSFIATGSTVRPMLSSISSWVSCAKPRVRAILGSYTASSGMDRFPPSIPIALEITIDDPASAADRAPEYTYLPSS